MTERSSPPPERGAVFGPTCPASPMLSEYLDGKLNPAERARIEEHISRCEDCYFVVRESAFALSAETGHDRAPSVLPSGGVGRFRFLAMAAGLVAVLGALILSRQATQVISYDEALRPLVDAVGERRFFEPRLAGAFKYGPRVSGRRSNGGGPDSEAWGVLAAASEVRERANAVSSEGRAARAAAALFLGEADAAVTEYSQLTVAEPDRPRWMNNLSAALLVRASLSADPRPGDLDGALRYAEAALSLDPALREAAFNRGLALKALGRVEEARRVFASMAGSGDAWSNAARDELRDLEGAGPGRP